MFDTNPYALLIKKCGLQLKEFGEKYGFAKQTLVFVTTGQYPGLSERMVLALGKECYERGVDAHGELLVAYGVGTLDEAYEAWRKDQRQKAVDVINNVQPNMWSETVSPMASLVQRTVGSSQGFAKLMKIPAATLSRYSKGKQRLMPSSIEVAFEEIRYPYLDLLIEKQIEWIEKHVK